MCLGSQTDKVFIVAGGSSGISYELTRILHGAVAKIYNFTTSEVEADQAIVRIEVLYRDKDSQNNLPETRGSREFIYVNLPVWLRGWPPAVRF